MNPESITTRQVIDNFTAKHWACTVAAIVATLTLAATLGNLYGKSESATQLADLKGQINTLSVEVNATEARRKDVMEKNAEWATAYKTLETNFQNEREKNSTLLLQLSQSSNNDFIQTQLTRTQDQIDTLSDTMATTNPSNYRDSIDLQAQALEARLRGYQDQLKVCR